jgi:hypothetical protein
MKPTKFKAKSIELDGYWFSSQGEAELYSLLVLMQKSGEIQSIQCQDYVRLGKSKYGMKPDFRVSKPDETFEWHEFKGYEQETWPRHKKMWAAYGPGKLHVWKKNRRGLFLEQTIVPVSVETGACPECGKPLEAA